MTTLDQARRIYDLWDEYARSGQINDLVGLYTEDAIFESPLVPVLMKRASGICRGHDEMRQFFRIGFEKRPNELVRWWRSGKYFFDGSTLIWEYPGQTPHVEQIDLLEVMDLQDGCISHHRVYWGFRGVNQLLHSQRDASTSEFS